MDPYHEFHIFRLNTVSPNYTLKSFLNIETARAYYLPTDFPPPGPAGPSRQMVTNCGYTEKQKSSFILEQNAFTLRSDVYLYLFRVY